MKLFNDLKQLLILGMCAGCLAIMPIATSAAQPVSNNTQAQQVDVTRISEASDVSKEDNPPKPRPKPGPRDGGADD